jgi:prefoldin subunit 5
MSLFTIEVLLLLIGTMIVVLGSLWQFLKNIVVATKSAYSTLLEIKSSISSLDTEVKQLSSDNTKLVSELAAINTKIVELELEIVEIFTKLRMKRRTRN